MTAHDEETGILKKPNHGRIRFWTKNSDFGHFGHFFDHMTDFGQLLVLFLKKLKICNALDTFEGIQEKSKIWPG